MHFIHKKKKQVSQSGFTIVELIVTLSIVVVVTGLVMIRYSSFNSSVLLNSQAYITAFDFREVQSLAVSVRGINGKFREEYGLYFSEAAPNTYWLFQDDDARGIDSPAEYDAGEEIGKPFQVDPRFNVVDICGTNTSGVQQCGLADMSITFKRPDFDAAFFSSEMGNINSAEIVIGPVSDSAFSRSVVVYATGQIVVE